MPESINLEELFQSYWKESFPFAPANKQAAASHVAFAQYAIMQVEAMRAEENQ
jgi:hypothetical protein